MISNRSYVSKLNIYPKYELFIREPYIIWMKKFRTTLILLPNSSRKRFINGIDLNCGHGNYYEQENVLSLITPSISLSSYENNNKYNDLDKGSTDLLSVNSDLLSTDMSYNGDESITEWSRTTNEMSKNRGGMSYLDYKNQLLSRSPLFINENNIGNNTHRYGNNTSHIKTNPPNSYSYCSDDEYSMSDTSSYIRSGYSYHKDMKM